MLNLEENKRVQRDFLRWELLQLFSLLFLPCEPNKLRLCLIWGKMKRKERNGGKREGIICLIREKLREGKENGGNAFPCDPSFFFPSQLGGNEKVERFFMEHPISFLFYLKENSHFHFISFLLSFSLSLPSPSSFLPNIV